MNSGECPDICVPELTNNAAGDFLLGRVHDNKEVSESSDELGPSFTQPQDTITTQLHCGVSRHALTAECHMTAEKGRVELGHRAKILKMMDDNKQLAQRIDGAIQSASQEVTNLRSELSATSRRLAELGATDSSVSMLETRQHNHNGKAAARGGGGVEEYTLTVVREAGNMWSLGAQGLMPAPFALSQLFCTQFAAQIACLARKLMLTAVSHTAAADGMSECAPQPVTWHIFRRSLNAEPCHVDAQGEKEEREKARRYNLNVTFLQKVIPQGIFNIL
ncbi:unnamed protein product [Pleuronectes platessa]|uniref:Kazrin n=1 Tax=Pleuronectes platessa TaxID=8262 RepID=A0A9N7UQ54_PLEPL|nr:unnamed protein product [Pleuronectes platessa]